MNELRLHDYLGHMQQAAAQAAGFVEGMSREDFLDDKRTQQAVVMSLIIIGEAAARTIEKYPGFVAQHPELGWYDMRGMRNRIAHGYFDINLAVVWDTIQVSLPELLERLPALLHAAQATEEGQGGL